MKTVIYVDELLLVNFAAAAALLLGAGALSGLPCTGLRLLAGAGTAALSSLILLCPALPFAPALAYKAATACAAVGATFGARGRRRALARTGAWYLLLNLTLSGLVLACGAGGRLPAAKSNNLAVYLDITPGLLLGCTGGVYMAVRGVMFCFGRPRRGCTAAVLELAGREIPVNAFLDTGFGLEDPLTGRAPVMVSYPAVRQFLPPELCAALEPLLGLCAGAAEPPPEARLRLIQCGTVAGSRVLPALPAARLTRQNGGRAHSCERVLAVFCCPPQDEGWSLLLGPALAGQLGMEGLG